ncbi:MAG TPA: DUF4192 domain-containing protein [Pedococcus sp.]
MTTIRLRGPADLLAALPYQLGYHPDDAIVVVSLRQRAVGLVQRLDLPPEEHLAEACDALLPALERDCPDAVLLVGYEREPGSSLTVLDAVRDACDLADLEVVDRLVVRDGRWYAPDCESGCCPPDGAPLPTAADTPAVADFVGLEVAPLRDRAAVGAQLDRDERRAAEVADALGAGAAFGLAPVGSGPRSHRAARADRERWLATWAVVGDVSASRPPVDGLAPDEVAALARSLRDVELRDAVIAWLCPGTLPVDTLGEDLAGLVRRALPPAVWGEERPSELSARAARRLQARLVELCRAMPTGEAAPMLTVLANLTWWMGDGTLTREALGRALALEPDYRLARLLARMVDLALRPRAAG